MALKNEEIESGLPPLDESNHVMNNGSNGDIFTKRRALKKNNNNGEVHFNLEPDFDIMSGIERETVL